MEMKILDNENKNNTPLSFESLYDSITGSFSALRIVRKLNPAGGKGTKVYPPSYSEGKYAFEDRIIDDRLVSTVILDSVQSQANRMEEALLRAYRKGDLLFPLIEMRLPDGVTGNGRITTLEVPHRIADAIFRESELEGVDFRLSKVGKAFANSNIGNATGLLNYCPQALIFGIWDSTGSKGGLGNKFSRAIVSEIVGINAKQGVQTSSRLDPLVHYGHKIIRTDKGEWKLSNGEKEEKSESKAKISEINLGNVTPTLEREKFGGVTIDHAIQTIVLSLPSLRRLHFPFNGEETEKNNNYSRTLLVSMSLAAIMYMMDEGYDLRSRCLLVPAGDVVLEIIANNGSITQYSISKDISRKIFNEGVLKIKEIGIPWPEEPIVVYPNARLRSVIENELEIQTGVFSDETNN